MGNDVGGLKPGRAARKQGGSGAVQAPKDGTSASALAARLRDSYLREQLRRMQAARARSHAAEVRRLLDKADPIGGTGDYPGAFAVLGGLPMPELLATLEELDRARMVDVLRPRLGDAGAHRARIEGALQALALDRLDPLAVTPDRLQATASSIEPLAESDRQAVYQHLLARRGVTRGAEQLVEGMLAMIGETSAPMTPPLPEGAGPMPTPIEPSPWAPSGDMPGGLYVGTEAHKAIAERYEDAHRGDSMFFNTTPITTLLKRLAESGHAPAPATLGITPEEALLRPDIINLTRLHLYEIKPWSAQIAALDKAITYVGILTRLGIPMTLGPVDEPGTKGELPAPAGVYLFWTPEPGVILYTYRHARLEPVVVESESRATERRWRMELKPLSPPQMATVATMTATMLILLMILLAPVGA